MDIFIDLIHAYLALAHAARGEVSVAKQNLRRAEPRLRALHEDDLLARCRQALGNGAAALNTSQPST
jgi:hypothetical protein